MADANQKSKASEQKKASGKKTSTPKGARPSTSAADSSPQTEAKAADPRKGRLSDAKKAWIAYYREHRHQVVCTLIGLLLGICILSVGFWATLLLVLFVLAGMLYGRYKDGDRRTIHLIDKLIDRFD